MTLPMRNSRPLQRIHIFGVQHRAKSDRTKRPWIVRWAIEGRQRSKSFRTRAEANRYRSLLGAAQHHGEWFDDETGEPASWVAAPGELQVIDWTRRWLAEQWAEWQPRTRKSNVIALARFVPLATRADAPKPPRELRAYLTESLRPEFDLEPAHISEQWLSRWSLALTSLDKALLSEVDRSLGIGDRGQPLAPSTAGRFRKVSRSCIRRASELDLIDRDPWPPQPAGRSQRKAARQVGVDIRMLPSPGAMQDIIDAIASHQPASRMYQTMTAVAYYGALRPSEVVMIRPRALHLPEEGWGRIHVTEADVDFDQPGDPKTGPREVPIPPTLVEALRTWLSELDLGPDDLLFRTRTGGRPQPSNWSRALRRATANVDHPDMRVYDCRHAAATGWLQAGVPLGEAARRLGHSVETLVSTYVGALESAEELSNERIDQFLAAG